MAFAPAAFAAGGSSVTGLTFSSTSATPKKGGNLTSALVGGSSKDNLDGQGYEASFAIITINLCLYETLLGHAPNFAITNMLAEEVTANKSATEWTARLKKGIEFSNGKSLTADDVIFSVERIVNPKSPGAGVQTSPVSSRARRRSWTTAQFAFSWTHPTRSSTRGLPTDENCIVPVGFDYRTVGGAIGTGPWKVVTFVPGQQTVLTPNTHYWGVGPYTDKLTITCFADPTAAMNALLGGTVDHVGGITGNEVSLIKGNSTSACWRARQANGCRCT